MHELVNHQQGLSEGIVLGRASMLVEHRRPQAWIETDGGVLVPDIGSYTLVDEPEIVWNQITNSGRDFLHLQGYGSSGLGSNGLNYIGLTNASISPSPTDTSLSGEITTNGLARAQGTYAHTAGTNTTTISYTFTASGTQSCQAAALFTAAGPPVSGIMNHELTFTQRSLISGDTLAVTYTITLG
jgi:hypothetical protein